MAQHHLAELRRFGREIMLGNEDEPFDFLAVHERRVWEHEAQRMNEALSRRGVDPLRIK
jgi:hypothetical protein